MKNTLLLIGLAAAAWLWQACAGDTTPYPAPSEIAGVELVVPGVDPNLYIDSAQVLFFRVLNGRDSLILRQVVHGISGEPRKFHFDLPAGYYTMVILGNVPTARMVFRPPYSQDSVWVSYQGGIEPPDIFLGRTYLNVGVDSARSAGNILLVSRVELTLKNVPAGIDRIEMQILETSSGMNSNYYLKEVMNPPLGASVTGVQADSTYTFQVNCFPPVVNDGKSSVQVRCYDANGKQVYSGTSQPFQVNYGFRMILTGTFGNARQSRVRSVNPETGDGKFMLEWNYDEKNR